MIEKECQICHNTFRVYPSGMARKTCSKECSYKLQSIRNRGENNPNFGNKWTDEQRKAGSVISTKRMTDPLMREKAGNANRGKKFSQERIDNMHLHRDRSSYSHKHTDETKKVIGKKSSEKWTDEYKEAHRKRFEDLGYWVKREDKSDYDIYFAEADWKERMFDRAEGEQKQLLEQLGVFSASTNSKGVVRDHMLSRRTGFSELIFPEILRHPANCQIMTHSDNVKKKKTRYVDKDSLTYDELCTKIAEYKGEYAEHSTCLKLINEYNDGKRWKRKE